MKSTVKTLVEASRSLSESVGRLTFGGGVSHVYNPLDYAREGWERYLQLAADGPREIMLLGMNPGPWGMAQTGVPFGEVQAVREWMGIQARIGVPRRPHPKRPIEGFACARSEVSGRRLWGLMASRFGQAGEFFSRHVVANYCPLVFMAESGRNVTPDKLPAEERAPLFELCDEFLALTIATLSPSFVIGVGRFAESRILAVTGNGSDPPVTTGAILHPSPASPAANRDWAGTATQQMKAMGAWH
jgi:single-strand selective monofunctional uracil DNA glycosylase